MVDGIILSEKTKEELIEIIKGLYKENEELKQAAWAKRRSRWNHPTTARLH